MIWNDILIYHIIISLNRGVILYYMLTSHYPFEDDEIYRLLNDMDCQRIEEPPYLSPGVNIGCNTYIIYNR